MKNVRCENGLRLKERWIAIIVHGVTSIYAQADIITLEGWEWGAWETPWSGQTPNCVKLLRWRFFHLFCVPALLVLGSRFHCWAMRVSEETLNCCWMCMGWWVSGLLLGAYITHQQHFLVSYTALLAVLSLFPVSYTHLTLPTTPYV